MLNQLFVLHTNALEKKTLTYAINGAFKYHHLIYQEYV